MSGIYIHIPFCKQACYYCDFHFSTSLKNKQAILAALKKEIYLQRNYLSSKEEESGSGKIPIKSVYFGGGTPSLLSHAELMHIFEDLDTYYSIDSDAEITLEANPDDLTKERIRDLKHTPVNRLSIGVQSFFDIDLKWMNRSHNANDALRVIKTSQDAGFENITIDLIYGTPTLTDEHWKKNLDTSFSLEVPHISSYFLTIEPRTALAHFIKQKKVENVDEQKSAKHFEMLLKEMQAHDFIQYEISNFCKEGFYSKHNSNYWLKEKYLGLGPSAHSYNGVSRQWNVANNNTYIQSLEQNKLDYEKEILTITQNYNEYILTSLRTIWGVDLGYIEKMFGKELLSNCMKEANSYFELEYLIKKENKLLLTDKGKLLADKISSDLFMLE